MVKTETIFFIDQTFHVWDKTINKEVSFSKKNLPNKHINSIVYVDTPHFNLIPSSIAENISNKEKADFISSNNQKKIIINQKINKLDCELCWLAESNDLELIKQKIPGAKIKHLAETLINFNIYSENTLTLYITENAVFISSYFEKKLKLINRFSITNNDDLLYYTLLTVKETGLSEKKFSINFLGKKNDILIQKLSSTIPYCSINKEKYNSYLSIINWESLVENIKVE